MSSQMKLCSECRARVLDDWTHCKFCGTSLVGESIGATMHPDDLVAPEDVAALPEPPAAASAAPEAEAGYDWSTWVNDPEPAAGGSSAWSESEESTPASGGDAGWGGDFQPPTGPAEEAAWGPTGAAPAAGGDTWSTSGVGDHAAHGALEVAPDAGPAQWIDGPAPGEGASTWQGDDVPSGTTGLDDVSWYTDPDPAAAASGPSLFAAGASAAPAPPTGPASYPDGDTSFSDLAVDDGPITFGAPPESAPPAGTEVAPVFQWQAAPDGWATERPEPDKAPRGQAVLSREVRLLAFGILLVVALIVVVDRVRGDGPSHPATWPEEVQQIASFVSEARGTPFDHPVAIVRMPAAEYDAARRAATEVTDDKARQRFADQVASYRALGLVDGSPEPELASAVLTRSGDGAFYDLRERRLVVRTGPLNATTRVAVAGALSVAMDDQLRNLDELRTGVRPDTPLLAVVAGAADLVRNDYAESLPPDEREGIVDPVESILGPGSELTGFVEVLEGAPARLGRPFVQAVKDVNSIQAVNEAVELPPLTDNQLFQPHVYFRGTRALGVETPEVPEGATKIDEGSFGATSWFLLLSRRIDARRSMTVVDGWGGDAMVTYRLADGKVCIALGLRGTNNDTTSKLFEAIQYWSQQLPAAVKVELGRADGVITLTGCDPGAKADMGTPISSGVAFDVPVLRSRIAADYYRAGTLAENGPNGPIFSYGEAWCMANSLVHKLSAKDLTGVVAEKGARYEQLTLEAGPSCGSTLAFLLFVEPPPVTTTTLAPSSG